jgi:hypothetical protein
MNTHDLRKKIDKAVQSEAKSNKLKKLLCKLFTESEAENTINFFIGYIRQTPDIMDLVFSKASSAGLLNSFQEVFNVVFGYWEENYDLISDHEGIAGLTDDAYLSLCLMQKIADSQPVGSRGKLLKLDLHDANNKMKMLFGNPLASKLDQMVETVYSSVTFQNQLNTLLTNPLLALGLQNFSMQQLGSNPQYWQYQQRLRDMNHLSNMKHDAFMGQLGSMAAGAGISFP